MQPSSLDEWLNYQQALHSQEIELGLERVRQVWQAMGETGFTCPIILVGGTNGKGSTVASLESIYHEAGYTTACYTSPHIEKYNERIRLNRLPVNDRQLVDAFELVEIARKDNALTYFEFGTLAALAIIQQAEPDIALLEVGLGGRLDAVNIVDPNLSIVTNVSLDHSEWLGDTVDQIAVEKAGIARQDRPLIIAQYNPPGSLIDRASQLGANIYRLGLEFDVTKDNTTRWEWRMGSLHLNDLPGPALVGDQQLHNSAAALCALYLLADSLPFNDKHIRNGLKAIRLAGRYEQIDWQGRDVIFDVAHNEAAAAALAGSLRQSASDGDTHVVVAMQSNRAMVPFLIPLSGLVDAWHIAELEGGIGHSNEQAKQSLGDVDPGVKIVEYPSIAQALNGAVQSGKAGDRVVVTGSFYTVAEGKKALAA